MLALLLSAAGEVMLAMLIWRPVAVVVVALMTMLALVLLTASPSRVQVMVAGPVIAPLGQVQPLGALMLVILMPSGNWSVMVTVVPLGIGDGPALR